MTKDAKDTQETRSFVAWDRRTLTVVEVAGDPTPAEIPHIASFAHTDPVLSMRGWEPKTIQEAEELLHKGYITPQTRPDTHCWKCGHWKSVCAKPDSTTLFVSRSSDGQGEFQKCSARAESVEYTLLQEKERARIEAKQSSAAGIERAYLRSQLDLLKGEADELIERIDKGEPAWLQWHDLGVRISRVMGAFGRAELAEEQDGDRPSHLHNPKARKYKLADK